jgi:flavorubredoxin
MADHGAAAMSAGDTSGIRISEIADGVHQCSTYLPDMNFSLNQYLVSGAEPLLFHTGMRWLFPALADSVARVLPVETMRWIAFGHVEADECGAMNAWLAAAPQSTVAQGMTGCMVSIGDLADREPRALADGEVLDIGGHRLRWLDTPHVPHAWEAGLLYDETTRTLFCGDLFTQMGRYAASTDRDVVGPAMAAEEAFPGSSSLHPATGATIRRLAALDIDVLAPMHAPAFTGECGAALEALAADYDERIADSFNSTITS